MESGATIGLLNIVKTGLHKFQIDHQDVTDVNLSFRSGTQHFYSVLTAGTGFTEKSYATTKGAFEKGVDAVVTTFDVGKVYKVVGLLCHLGRGAITNCGKILRSRMRPTLGEWNAPFQNCNRKKKGPGEPS